MKIKDEEETRKQNKSGVIAVRLKGREKEILGLQIFASQEWPKSVWSIASKSRHLAGYFALSEAICIQLDQA